jgi:hypothetical protein
MSPPEPDAGDGAGHGAGWAAADAPGASHARRGAPHAPAPRVPLPGYGGYVALLVVVVVVAIGLNTLLSDSKNRSGLAAGQTLPPFAVPLVLGSLGGEANVATHAGEGEAGKVPACSVRGPEILNVCQLYEQGPVVLALFVDAASCPAVLSEMQALVPWFPGVRFAAVSIEGSRSALRQLIHSRGLTLPVGIDKDGALVALYKVDSCPQLTFAYPGGVVQGKTLQGSPSASTLRARVGELVSAARARGLERPAA